MFIKFFFYVYFKKDIIKITLLETLLIMVILTNLLHWDKIEEENITNHIYQSKLISTYISLCCLLLLINLISPYLLNKSHYLRGLISCELFDFFTLKRIIPQQVRPSVFYWFVILVKGRTLIKLCSNSHYWLWKSLFDLIYYYPIIIIWEYWFQAMRDQVQFAPLSLKHWVTIIWFINILI